MTYLGSDYYTAHAYRRAQVLGIDLNPESGKAIVEKIQSGDIFWKGHPDKDGGVPIYMNYLNRRIRFIVNEDNDRIISLSERDFASMTAIKQAEALGLVLNFAMANLIMDKIKSRDVIEIGKGLERTADAKMVVADVGLRVVFSEESGAIIKVDDYTGPRVVPQHPAVSRHAAERAMQRYNVELTPEISNILVERIVTGTDLIDHFKMKSGSMAVITEIAPDKPACIIYQRVNGSVPIRLLTVTPMTHYEAHEERVAASREARHETRRAALRARFETRKRTRKRENARNRHAMREDHEDSYGYE